jgi:hypothetical protein
MHIDPDLPNTLEPRTNWAICMGPTGNLQGSYKFLLLATGKKVTRRRFTEMPITEAVIRQVEARAVKDGAVKGINFKNRKGEEYEFDNLTTMKSTKCWLSQTIWHPSPTSRQRHQVC